MKGHLIPIFLCFLSLAQAVKVTDLSTRPIKVVAKSAYDDNFDALDLYFYPGLPKAPQRVFTSVSLVVETSGEERRVDAANPGYEVYQSGNLSLVEEEAAASRRFLGWFRRFALWRSSQIPAFPPTYLGIHTNLAYSVRLRVTYVNLMYVGLFVVGVLGYLWAPRLTRHAAFYYASGTGVGILASLLILVFVLYKILPRRSLAYSVLIGGWSFSCYILYTLWQNLYTVLIQYQRLVAAYLVSVTLLSFAICYRLGPPRNPRSINLLQWTLQLGSLALVMTGCQVTEMGLAFVITLVLITSIPSSFLDGTLRLWRRWFPAKPRLLTEAEYEKESREATAAALRELRTYCRSPECDSWRTISRLKSPQRMADFVDGGSHLCDAEVLAFDIEASLSSTDDDSSDPDPASDSDDEPRRVLETKSRQFSSFYSPPTRKPPSSEGRSSRKAAGKSPNGHPNGSLPNGVSSRHRHKASLSRRRIRSEEVSDDED